MNGSNGHGLAQKMKVLRAAALDQSPIRGLTHNFYRYPARFSPRFVAAAINEFSEPGDVVLDPYMGGGTTVVEAMASGRRAIGCDLNSLAVFVTRVKTTRLSDRERIAVRRWGDHVVPNLLCNSAEDLTSAICPTRTRNLTLPIARPIKKVIALGLMRLDELPTLTSRRFARCALLNVAQWALNGRSRQTPSAEFRARVQTVLDEMLNAISELHPGVARHHPRLINDSAANLGERSTHANSPKAHLVVTSPPYPGIHMLYHRWQVDGRRESPAPYWIAGCNDGQGCAFYNFADRRESCIDRYFEESLRTLRGIRLAMNDGAMIVQMIAFSNPSKHLGRYLDNMRLAGFAEVRPANRAHRRIWRCVPNRQWHATSKGALNASNEVVLLHRAH